MLKTLSLLLVLLMIFSGCTPVNYVPEKDYTTVDYNEFRAIWISYYDLDFSEDSVTTAKEKIDLMFQNIASSNLNTVFVHVRANADALYKSDIFPCFETIKNLMANSMDFDVFNYMIKSAHNNGLELHAWFNPYRISNTISTPEQLPDGHIAKTWFNEGNIENEIVSYNEKLYFNPAVTKVQKLIIDGVREVIEKYDIDGIHFDDYFYPECDETFDLTNYNLYCEKTTFPLSLTEWRAANISTLVSAIKNLAEQNSLPFGVSPAAHINGDYLSQNGYADIKNWLLSGDYVDYVIPQIYWGFDYPAEEYSFENMLNSWTSLEKDSSVKLYVGLAAYKVGTEDKNNEWINNTDILKRQILSLRQKGVRGFALFSYSYFYDSKEINTKERENVNSLLK